MWKNRLIRKLRSISKFMTSQSGKHTFPIHVLPNISKSKGIHTMKFGQLIDSNMKSIFFGKSNTKCDGEAIPRPFLKKSQLSISLD